jgi:hypothetical protein
MSKLYVDNINPNSSWTTDEIAGNTIKQSDAGTILQVVTVNSPVKFNTTSSTFTTLGLSATLTPKSTSSKFLVNLQGHVAYNNQQTQGNATQATFQFYRSNTAFGGTLGNFLGQIAAGSYLGMMVNLFQVDEPATTSEITYHVDLKEGAGQNYIGWCCSPAGAGSTATTSAICSGQLIVMEIAG